MKTLPPEIGEQIVKWDYENERISYIAQLEAQMTFMKRKTGAESANEIYIDPSSIKTKQDVFTFAKIFSATLAHLELGNMDVWPDVEKAFLMDLK